MIKNFNFVTVVFLLLDKKVHFFECTLSICWMDITLTSESTVKCCFQYACLQIYALFIRNQTACFEKSGVYFASSYFIHQVLKNRCECHSS